MIDFRFNREVSIKLADITLNGNLGIPQNAKAIIIFSHGSGSSRFSKRNQMVAGYLQENNFGTLLFDLLTPAEDLHYPNRFNIDLLTKRLSGVTKWLAALPAAKNYLLGYFGASTGAASALKAAIDNPAVNAIVSRGGRPDLVMDVLGNITAPTLLIVGSKDYDVLMLNYKACQRLKCEKKLEVVNGATHLFEEKGAMEKVCELATGWFDKQLIAVQ